MEEKVIVVRSCKLNCYVTTGGLDDVLPLCCVCTASVAFWNCCDVPNTRAFDLPDNAVVCEWRMLCGGVFATHVCFGQCSHRRCLQGVFK